MPDQLNISNYPTIDVENLDPVQDLVLFVNNDNKLAIMQYYHDRVCLIGVIDGVIYDENELRDFTRMDNR